MELQQVPAVASVVGKVNFFLLFVLCFCFGCKPAIQNGFRPATENNSLYFLLIIVLPRYFCSKFWQITVSNECRFLLFLGASCHGNKPVSCSVELLSAQLQVGGGWLMVAFCYK